MILDDPAPHIGQIYDLTGPESADLNHYARVSAPVVLVGHSYGGTLITHAGTDIR